MADFDLQQTDQQVQDILNDAQDAMGAGAQTTLTTDYIMLKGTNGRYHKILKDSFTEAVRNVLGGLLVNNDKGTTISQIAAIASGDFGSITPANLASVLGAAPREWPIVREFHNSSETYPNIDELTTPCRIRTYDSANTQRLSGNLPFTTAIELFHLCESWEYVQIATTYAQNNNANHKIWRRTKSRIEGSAWTVWKTIEFT